ncbi:MAG: PPOX class probable FMN-dependent enzyme [Verrucomicrobiales bacterium]|jgi:PPOX class probable FMN-dependent enzyme
MRLDSHDELRSVYRMPRGGAVDKVITTLDEHCATFLSKSPFMVLSTADATGAVDGSPKGGEPGFAHILDDGRVGWADSSGNNRLDSFENVVTNPNIAMLFMIPGLDESLRINGTAELTTDPAICEDFSYGSSSAKVVVLVTVNEAYIHCAKAYRRAGLWDPDSWLSPDLVPNGVAILKDHASISTPVEEIEVE